ncbi:unannotated protein [freshwater metagenome]|uniref:Unannotated protein n=1 Tax=freshwater metagenome TaxID=449393 RepID=A0A6J7AT90_9ZZZZ
MRRSGVGRSAATVPRGGLTWPGRPRGAPGGLEPHADGLLVVVHGNAQTRGVVSPWCEAWSSAQGSPPKTDPPGLSNG